MKRRLLDGFIVLVVSLFVLYQVYTYKPGIIDTCMSYYVYPILVVQNKVTRPIRAYRARRALRNQLENNYKQLHEQYIDERAQRLAAQAKLDMLDDTKELREFAQRYDFSAMRCVQIVARQQTDTVRMIIVDAGSRHGITTDMCAVYKNCLVGRVVQVFPYMSRVQLITDKQCSVPVICSQTKTRGICVGKNSSDELSLDFVSHLEPLIDGDTVFTQGEGLLYPRGFAIGTIASYQAGPLHYTVTLKPMIDFMNIDYCYIISKDT